MRSTIIGFGTTILLVLVFVTAAVARPGGVSAPGFVQFALGLMIMAGSTMPLGLSLAGDTEESRLPRLYHVIYALGGVLIGSSMLQPQVDRTSATMLLIGVILTLTGSVAAGRYLAAVKRRQS
jgi:hypothetical protein